MWHTLPLHGVLVACWCLADAERRDELRATAIALRAARLTNHAMWDHKALESAQRRFDLELAVDPNAPTEYVSPALASAREQLRLAGRITS